MTPEESQLIAGLFERMRNLGVTAKDKDAEALINRSVQAFQDAPYMLVQSVLVQEHALQQAGTRIQELEEKLRTTQRDQQEQPSSFLGGLFGGGRAAPERRSDSGVPEVGTKTTPAGYGSASPWSQGQSGLPSSSGFLRSAMSTAAGVAGGMLAAGAIRDLLGGGAAHAGSMRAAETDQARRDHETLARQDAEDDAQADQDDYDDAQADAEDDWSGQGGGDPD
jgi:uncharacterized protein